MNYPLQSCDIQLVVHPIGQLISSSEADDPYWIVQVYIGIDLWKSRRADYLSKKRIQIEGIEQRNSMTEKRYDSFDYFLFSLQFIQSILIVAVD